MANMNITSPTAAKIFTQWEKRGSAEEARDYLGASIIGHPCDRWLWYQFRGVFHESFSGRMYRLFDRGKREEAVFCDDLRRIGCEVKEFDENGNQFAVSAYGGHFGGHMDGVVKGLDEAPTQWHVVEFKTHSDASFKKLCKEGVRRAKPMHYDQMQTYMGSTGLTSALYMAVNKDNDDLWCERVKFDKAAYDRIMARAKHIIDCVSPDRCATRMDELACKMCPAHNLCWNKAPTIVDASVPVTCRTCCHATAVTEGEGKAWTCRFGRNCAKDRVCEDHLILPIFVSAEILDGTDKSITYSLNGVTFKAGAGGFSTEELKKTPKEGLDAIVNVKNETFGTVSNSVGMLKRKYGNMTKQFVGTLEELRGYLRGQPVINWAEPKYKEELDGVEWIEYALDNCLAIDKAHDVGILYSEECPF